MTFEKILVANRGEIAIRIMRAANELGIRTVAVFAEEDKLGLHRFKSDEAYRIGEGLGPVGAYLSIDEMVRVARESGADAIHPGYGLLSENPDFVDACADAGITFIGPSSAVMRRLGDKASARQVAIEAGVPVVPATGVLGDDMDAIAEQAEQIGYPVMLKASWGGGGRGMRAIHSPDELADKVAEGRREAEAAFGNGEGYLERMITRARHVEVQVLGDLHGDIIHLWERDCSVQRRNQKVVERAPAPYLSQTQREELCELGRRMAAAVDYSCAGTVEFLMDMDTGAFSFIEVNPRVQVEHTVTEEVTGIDIVRAQILIAAGATLAEATGVAGQDEVALTGHAIQCRITTEDPANSFIPDYGRITAYRSATGMGIRLDGGTAYAGAVITRHYDSLLEKVTAWAPTPGQAIARMDRALREFRIRGVATNITFVENLLRHPTFLADEYTTRFIDETPELFDFTPRRDRATRLLTYIADITVNGHPETVGRREPSPHRFAPRVPDRRAEPPPPGTRQILDEQGADALAAWLAAQDRVLVTDTSMRDAHQSLLATRMRTVDMLNVAPAYAANLPGLFSVECWGGATFDVAHRFLQESPWGRLAKLRDAMPNLLMQMLLRASNGVGYTNYPDNVVTYFVEQAAAGGVDVFRVFDSLNWVQNMHVAMDAVRSTGKVCEAAMCYTGDLLDPDTTYDLDYYVGLGRSLRDAGAHVLGVKDMAGLLRPAAARELFPALRDEVGLPLHFHTHDTSGIAAATVLAAVETGVDAVDLAMDAVSGNTSQPTMGSVVAALAGTPRDPALDLSAIREISNYWEQVRASYAAFESGMQAPASEVYLHEMPGGQFTNLRAQARSMGLEERWHEVAAAYAEVNEMFGDIVKVTPSSKVVGDMALLMVSQGLTRDEVEDPAVDVSFPDSVVEMMAGSLGQPPGGWPPALQAKVLGDRIPITDRPGAHLEPVDLEAARADATAAVDGEVDDQGLASYLMYPTVYTEFRHRHADYGPVWSLPTETFFYGMQPGDEITAEIDPGKTLEIRFLAVGEADERGTVKAFFELNGQPRSIRVPDRSATSAVVSRPKADPASELHVGAPMPGVVASVVVEAGAPVTKGTLLLTIEAMKMETGLHAQRDGSVATVHVGPGDAIEAKDLLVELSP